MKDTNDSMHRKMIDLLKKKSGAERLRMGFSMYSMARKLVTSSLRSKSRHWTPADFRKELFLRFYGNDLDPKTQEKRLNSFECHRESPTDS